MGVSHIFSVVKVYTFCFSSLFMCVCIYFFIGISSKYNINIPEKGTPVLCGNCLSVMLTGNILQLAPPSNHNVHLEKHRTVFHIKEHFLQVITNNILLKLLLHRRMLVLVNHHLIINHQHIANDCRVITYCHLSN